jgi:hypothetical protein
MESADVTNGEAPDPGNPTDAGAGDASPHRTGERQAQENRDNDPPA